MRVSGDLNVEPNLCLAPIEEPLFYAVQMVPGGQKLAIGGGVLAAVALLWKLRDK